MVDKKFLYYMELTTSDLSFGLFRRPEWWDTHQDWAEMLEKIRASIALEGLRNPLTVTETLTKKKSPVSEKRLSAAITERGYLVEHGNQRLQAMRDLGIQTAPCIVISEEKKSIPSIKTDEQLASLFKDGFTSLEESGASMENSEAWTHFRPYNFRSWTAGLEIKNNR